MNRQQLKAKKKHPANKKIFKNILLFFIIVFLCIGAYGAYITYKTYQAANQSFNELERGHKSKLREVAVEAGKDPISILLMGIEDYSSGGVGRTDSLMVATLNPEDQSMKLVSIPRDTLVYLVDRGKKDKINHAYAFGGKEATITAIEDLLDIPIDYYATVNFKGFKDIINEIGGITVDVPFDFWEKSDVDGSRIEFYKGQMKLNGEEALAYARMRKRDPRGDFGRNDRQKQIISSSVDKILSPANLLKLDKIADHVGKNVETNLRISEALGIQAKYGDFNSKLIDQLVVKGSDEYINGVYYFVPDENEMIELQNVLKAHLDHNKSGYRNNNVKE
ncbi:LCP family protein [Metabacillus indicus]|uniref:LytR family transcriptional regulator n=1 Tax=Metabacillus indicus TaxID=246786 RepID=A0A084GXU7_METID|nr:LCP family protein [Metabacillus indicus]KEZ52159.1 LytR family transcriptional regulator [Metabacillus indicus]